MALYDYKCRNCGAVSEILMRKADDCAKCPECGSEDMGKLVSASYRINMNASQKSNTCCGRAERCDSPPCSTGRQCHRH
jgi:putative FmdB family regulatory protein